MRLRLPLARIVSVLLFAALCAIAAAWALQLLAPRAPIAPAGAVAQTQPLTDLSAAGQLFGGVPKPVGEATEGPSNIQVAGVLAAGPRGVALLVIDGRPARPFAVGEPVSEGLRVRSVTGDAVELERDGQPMRLAAPPRGSLAVLTSGPQRATAGGGAPASSPSGAPPPLPPRALPPAGAAAASTEPPPPQGVVVAPPPMPAGAMPPVAAPAPGAVPSGSQ